MLAILLASALAAGCQKVSDEGDPKRMPKPPPPPGAILPETAHVAVTIDGKDATPIDAAKLAGTPPDFQDDERRAWKLRTLLGDTVERAGVVIAAAASSGPEVLMHARKGDADPEPVLVMSRRGELVATMISPGVPFPEYHGRGGRLGRSGDPLPRISGVKKLRVYVAP